MCCTTEPIQTGRKKGKPRSVFVGLWWWPHVKWNAEYRTVQYCTAVSRAICLSVCVPCVWINGSLIFKASFTLTPLNPIFILYETITLTVCVNEA